MTAHVPGQESPSASPEERRVRRLRPKANGAPRAERVWLARAAERAFRRGERIPEGHSSPGTLRREGAYKHALAIADVLSAGVAVVVSVLLLGDDDLTLGVLITIPLVVWISKIMGLYDRDEHLLKKTTLDEAPAIFQVATLWTLVLSVAEGLLIQGDLGSRQVLGLWGLLFVSLVIGRLLARRLARAGTPVERCLVIGDESIASWLHLKLASSSGVHATLIGRVPLAADDDPEHRIGSEPETLGALEELGVVLAAHDVDRVIIAPATADSELILGTIRLVKSLGVRVSVLPDLFDVVGSAVEFDELDGTTLLGVRRAGLTRSSRAVKRSMDLVVAGVAGAVLSPVWIAASVAIKLTSPGPILFRQARMGRDGREFQILKFRTMFEGAEDQQMALHSLNEAEGFFKMTKDPRVTGAGRILRRFSIDELPQLVNVLKGDMSVVGPRPLPLEEDARVEGWERARLGVWPGMTGLWQIFGSARIPMNEMVKIDYLYGANWSLWLDLKILLRTVPYVFSGRGV